jgi:hypothetical protein
MDNRSKAMTENARLKSSNIATLLFIAALLALAAGTETATAQQPGTMLAEPATAEEAARVLDLRTIPMLEGAIIQMRSLGILVYLGKGSPKEAFEFQRRELAKRGFQELPGRNRDATATHGDFTKDGFHVSAGASEVTGDPEKVGWSRVNVLNYGNVVVDKLPAPVGVKLNHAQPQRVTYNTSASPTETAASCRKLLLAAGWEPYGETPSPHPDQPDASMQFFKWNAIRLESWIMTVELQGKKSTSISYDTELLSADLPAPAGATELRYDDWQTNLTFDLPGGKPDALLAFYQERLSKQGWKATTERPIADDRDQSQFFVYRNSQRDLISVHVVPSAAGVHARLNHQTAAEVAEEERHAKAEAEIAKQELARKNMRIKVAVPLPPAAQKLTKKDASEFEFSLKTGSGPAALETLREHVLREGWTEGKREEFDKRRGGLKFTNDGDEVRLSYFDLGDVDITVSGSERIVLEPVPSKDAPPAGAPKAAKQPAAAPAIPGLPALPPGIELPPEVKAQLDQALEDIAKLKDSAKKAAAPGKKPAPAKGPPAAKTPTITVHNVPAANTFQRLVTEKPLGSIGELDLSKRDNNKPNFFVSPDGRRFAYLIEKTGVVIDGKEYLYPGMYQGGVKERTFRFSPDSQHTAWVARVGEQGDTLVLD